ncbi:15932_t:CDS:1 [Cetraspora pellucida]|uniref:15932_t:CDS:1 n=1 Tax=Cetraspora pellucida TaxID=1433469 RepID=A0A9N9AUM9_9GLOM|nr:15932_t:CDS:1 [Cetraspora pellucida]
MDSLIIPFRLPSDCVREVIYHLPGDYNALFSCALVNRSWCRFTIPLLWSDVFSSNIPSDKKVKVIPAYVKCLSEIQRQTLINNNITLQEDFIPALFNYPKYLKFLNCRYFDNALYYWCKAVIKPDTDNTEFQNILHICNQVISQYILSNSIGLHTLFLSPHSKDETCTMRLLPDTCDEGIYRAFSKLTELHIENWFSMTAQNISTILLILEKLSLYSHYIQKLVIIFNQSSDPIYQQEVIEHLSLLINSQYNLQSFTIKFPYNSNSQSSLSLPALSSQSDSLKYLEISKFCDIPLLIPYLTSVNLETLNLIFYHVRTQFEPSALPSLPSGTQFRIKNLIISGTHYPMLYSSFSLIVKMSGSNLEKISIKVCDETIRNAIGEYCSNLTSLTIMVDFTMFEQFLNLLSKLKKLKYLDIEKKLNDIQLTKEMVLEFTKIIPNTLEELNFDLVINQEHFNEFLKELKVPLSKLTIHLSALNDETLNFIVDYAIRTGKLKELCFDATNSLTEEALSKAKDVILIITDITEDDMGFGLFD